MEGNGQHDIPPASPMPCGLRKQGNSRSLRFTGSNKGQDEMEYSSNTEEENVYSGIEDVLTSPELSYMGKSMHRNSGLRISNVSFKSSEVSSWLKQDIENRERDQHNGYMELCDVSLQVSPDAGNGERNLSSEYLRTSDVSPQVNPDIRNGERNLSSEYLRTSDVSPQVNPDTGNGERNLSNEYLRTSDVSSWTNTDTGNRESDNGYCKVSEVNTREDHVSRNTESGVYLTACSDAEGNRKTSDVFEWFDPDTGNREFSGHLTARTNEDSDSGYKEEDVSDGYYAFCEVINGGVQNTGDVRSRGCLCRRRVLIGFVVFLVLFLVSGLVTTSTLLATKQEIAPTINPVTTLSTTASTATTPLTTSISSTSTTNSSRPASSTTTPPPPTVHTTSIVAPSSTTSAATTTITTTTTTAVTTSTITAATVSTTTAAPASTTASTSSTTITASIPIQPSPKSEPFESTPVTTTVTSTSESVCSGSRKCYSCHWPDPSLGCLPNGNMTGTDHGQVMDCACGSTCFSAIRNGNEVHRGCSTHYSLWNQLSQSNIACQQIETHFLCFCFGDRCNVHDMTKFKEYNGS